MSFLYLVEIDVLVCVRVVEDEGDVVAVLAVHLGHEGATVQGVLDVAQGAVKRIFFIELVNSKAEEKLTFKSMTGYETAG